MKCTLSFLVILYISVNSDAQQLSKPYQDLITPEGLNSSLSFFASDYFEGRRGGTPSEKAAAEYLASCYSLLGIPPVKNNYFQSFQFTLSEQTFHSQNVIAFIEGSDPILRKEVIILSAHYDHLGKDTTLNGDQIFNGAADDGSGTIALLLIAKGFATAVKNGVKPKRSILFLHTGSEERGVRGSYHYVNDAPAWPIDQTAAVINMDGVGGFDRANLPDNSNYVYVLHADSTSSYLYDRTKELNRSTGTNLDLLYPKNASRFNSDHIPFAQQLVPAIYFSTGLTENYHQVTDEAETIDYDHMAKITKLVFSVAWDLANAAVIKSKVDRHQFVKTGKFYCPPCGCSKDKIIFDSAGICDACTMGLIPFWKRK